MPKRPTKPSPKKEKAAQSTSRPRNPVAVLDQSFKLSDSLKKKTNARLAEKLRVTRRAALAAKAAFADFFPSRIHKDLRLKDTYFAPGDDLRTAQQAVMTKDIEQAGIKSLQKGFTLKIGTENLLNMGIDPTATTKIKGPALARLHEHIKSLLRYGGIFGQKMSRDKCLAGVKAQAIESQFSGGGAPVPEVPPGGGLPPVQEPGGVGGGEIDPDKLVKDSVALQMKNAASPESSVTFGVIDRPRPEAETVTREIKTLSLSGGPADVTAYHDFHHLQIAFQPIWMEVFDAELRKKGEELYAQWVKTQSFFADSQAPLTCSTYEQLQQLYEDLTRMQTEIAGSDPCFLAVRSIIPYMLLDHWMKMDNSTRELLFGCAMDIQGAREILEDENAPENQKLAANARIIDSTGRAASVVGSEIDRQAKAPSPSISRLERLFYDLDQIFNENCYAFDVFSFDSTKNERSVNFGLLLTYRQKWEPLNYQVGELVTTIPLAPKESRKYNVKRVVKKSRSAQEIEDNQSIRKREASDTYRYDTEITRRAVTKSNFKNSAEGSVNMGVWNAKLSYDLVVDSERVSSELKKDFREAVIKAAEEFKAEHKMDVTTTSGEELEETTSGEILNPNDEIPVTYLFYELQRTYEISEQIHRVTPCILVANDFPAPHEISEAWLLQHDWILRRVLLDDSFIPALDYLHLDFAGQELAVEVLRKNFNTQIQVVDKVSQQISAGSKALAFAEKAMEKATEDYAASLTEYDDGGWGIAGAILTGGLSTLGGGSVDAKETLRMRMEAAKEGFGRVERAQQELRSRLEREMTALQAATDKYTEALKEQFNRRTAILRLRAHIKQNIMYYMQAIWDHEPPDQRFFRLYDAEVPDLSISGIEEAEIDWYQISEDGSETTLAVKYWLSGNFDPDKRVKLAQIADMDNILGYKGNYVIFPMKENNAITLFMMQDFIRFEEEAICQDPGVAGLEELDGYSVDELIQVMKCYHDNHPEAYEKLKDKFRTLLAKRLSGVQREKGLVVVPTNSLYIEALPGKHPVLEDFKLLHRAIDVKKVQAEVRHAELENIRLAARSLKGEYEDPDIEKKIVIEGANANVIVTPD